jgi:hypothetical protein
MEKTLHKNRAGGMAQGEGTEFKPQYHKKKKKKVFIGNGTVQLDLGSNPAVYTYEPSDSCKPIDTDFLNYRLKGFNILSDI